MPDFVLTAKDGTRHRITAPNEAAARKMLAGQGGESKEEAGGHLAAAGTGLRRLVEGIAGLPGTAREAQLAAAEAIGRWLNAPGAQSAIDGINKARQFRSVPTVEEVTAATTNVIGAPYKPKTTAEEYTATAAEFLPGLLVGGGPVRKGIQWLLPALLSETGGQIARRTIPQYEPHVRFGLGLGAEFLPGGILRMTTGPHALRAPARADTLQPPSVSVPAGHITGGEGPRYAGGGPADVKSGAIAEQQGATFPQAVPDRPGIDAGAASPIEASVVDDSATNAVRQAQAEPMTSRIADGMSISPSLPQQSFPSVPPESFVTVPPDSKLARIIREGSSAPHSVLPLNHPVRAVPPRVSDLVENKPGAIVDKYGNPFTHTVPDRIGINADRASPTVMLEDSVVDDAATNAVWQAQAEPMTSRIADGMSISPSPSPSSPQQSFPSVPPESFVTVPPNSKLARIIREGVQSSAPHSVLPPNHPVRAVPPRVSDLVENKPGAIVDKYGNPFTHTIPDRVGIDADVASPIVMPKAAVVEDTATNVARQALLETMTPRIGNGTLLVPAQPRQGIGSLSSDHELAGLFREGVHPQVPQTPILRYDPPRGVPSRIADLIANRYVRDKIIENIERGIRMGGPDWFNMEPLRLAFIDELKDLEGGQRFDHFFDLFGATTALSRARENLRNTSFYYTLSDRLPDVNPYPYGHRAQALHRRNVVRVWSGGLDPLIFPKSVSISANAKGNYLPVTVDSNIFRQAAMLSGDTRFLTTFLPIKSGGSRNIRREYNAGLISPEELSQPSYWSPAPRRNEYPAMEQYFQGIARELGMTPAQAEASAWLGGAELTGLGSDPRKKLMDFYKDSLLRTAIEKDMDPRDVLRRTIRAQLALLTLGGVALAPQLRSPEEGRR